MYGINLLNAWKTIQWLISSEVAMSLLTLVVVVITVTFITLASFTKLGKSYRWVFSTSGLFFLGAILYVYTSIIGSGFLVRVIWPIIGILWFITGIAIFAAAVSLRKEAKSEE